MVFTRSDVEAIAGLANLDLDDKEIDLFARQLGDILEYANQVQQIDTTGVSPTASVVTRHQADRARRGAAFTRQIRGAGQCARRGRDRGLFRVPRVIG